MKKTTAKVKPSKDKGPKSSAKKVTKSDLKKLKGGETPSQIWGREEN